MASAEEASTVSAETGLPAVGDEDLPVGALVGEYAVESKLGEGGFGAVYRAMHPLIGKAVAVKVLNHTYSASKDIVARFVDEARAVNQIRHRNIIDIFSFGALPDGRQYYVMELLEGRSFDEYLDEVGAMSPSDALPILRAVAKALDAAHAVGIVHRDLKPANIFLVNHDDGPPFPKLLDFGIAKLMPSGDKDDRASGSGHRTRTGVQIGTPYFMSPEQCRGIGVDHRSDVYAFGVLSFRVLTGKLPFSGESMMDVMMNHVGTEPPRPSAFASGLEVAFDAPILRMLAKDRDARPQSVGAAVEELAKAAGLSSLAASGARAVPMTTPAEQVIALVEPTVVPGVSAKSALRSGPARIGLGALVFLAVAGAAVVAARGLSQSASTVAPGAPSALAAVATAQAPTAAVALPAQSAAVAPAAATVSVLVEAPAGAEVSLDDVKLGATPGPFSLPTGDRPLKLVVTAKGFVPKTIEVTPRADVTLKANLTPVAAAAPLHHDLDRPPF